MVLFYLGPLHTKILSNGSIDNLFKYNFIKKDTGFHLFYIYFGIFKRNGKYHFDCKQDTLELKILVSVAVQYDYL